MKKHFKVLEVRFATAAEIQGIKSSHAIIPSETDLSVLVKPYSFPASGSVKSISARELQILFNDIRGFVIYVSSPEERWNHGYVQSTDEDIQEIEVYPLDTGINCGYEFEDKQITVQYDNILLLVEPRV